MNEDRRLYIKDLDYQIRELEESLRYDGTHSGPSTYIHDVERRYRLDMLRILQKERGMIREG